MTRAIDRPSFDLRGRVIYGGDMSWVRGAVDNLDEEDCQTVLLAGVRNNDRLGSSEGRASAGKF